MSKIYLPKDEKELFSLASSKDGFVIPLVNFGYPGFHVTVFSKRLEKGLHEFNIHIKNEISGKKIVNKSRIFSPKKLEQRLNKKLEKLREVCLSHFKMWEKKKPIDSKNMVCLECLRNARMSLLDLNKKEEARRLYENLSSLEIDETDLNKFPICNHSKHVILCDITNNRNYYKIGNCIITEKENKEYLNDIISVFKEELDQISDFFHSIQREFMEIIKSKKLFLFHNHCSNKHSCKTTAHSN